MKKLLLILPFIFASHQALALDKEDEQNYTQHYTEQMTPMVVKKLSADRPDMTANAIKMEANGYVAKMASCQLEGLKQLWDQYRDQAILPVAQGAGVAETTQALNKQLMQDIEAGTLTRDQADAMLGNAQETVQICMNS